MRPAGADDAVAFADGEDLIRFDVLKDHDLPGHRTEVDRSGSPTRGQVLPLIVLAKIARSGFHFAPLGLGCDRQFQLRAHAITIALLYCSNEQRIAAHTLIAEEVRRLAIVRDRRSSRHRCRCRPMPGRD